MKYITLLLLLSIPTIIYSADYQKIQSTASSADARRIIKKEIFALADECRETKIQQSAQKLAALQSNNSKHKEQINQQLCQQNTRETLIQSIFEDFGFDPQEQTVRQWYKQLNKLQKKMIAQRTIIESDIIKLAYKKPTKPKANAQIVEKAKKVKIKKEKPLFEQY